MELIKEGEKEESYVNFIRYRIAPFSVTRIMPFLTSAFLTLFLARSSFDSLSMFGYIMSIFMVSTTLFTMPLMVVGNISASQKNLAGTDTVFYSGMVLAVILSFIAASSNYFVYKYFLDLQMFGIDAQDFLPYILVYLPAIFLLGINSYLYVYLESISFQKQVSYAKIVSSLTSIASIFMFFVLGEGKEYILYAFLSLLVGEVSLVILLALIFILKYIRGDGERFSLNFISLYPMKMIVKLGAPIAIGMCAQKIIIYLINERLLELNTNYVGLFSVFGSLSALLLIPVTAFCQANSLYISGRQEQALKYLGSSVLGFSAVFTSVIIFGYLTYPYLEKLFSINDQGSILNNSIFTVLCYFVFSSGFLTFSTSSLRGLNETLLPQVTINAIMLGVFIPILWSSYFDNAGFLNVIMAQSTFLLLSGIYLMMKFYSKARRLS